jgi:hypothetical protein
MTATFRTPAFLMASMRGLEPGAGTSAAWVAFAKASAEMAAQASAATRRRFMINSSLFPC